MFVGNIIPVEDVLVRPEILENKFECDLNKCKGACCTLESEYGAPLLEEEVGEIEKILDIVKSYLPESHLEEIEKRGFYDIKDGDLMVSSVNNRACVFAYFDGDIARCAIEKAYFDEKIKFRKPISCHLFPIRVSKFGGDVLRFEKFNECSPAIDNGEKNNTKVIDFCRDSLTRLYGKQWYLKLKDISGT
ncbi:MAG: DUF3109 family protein [Ignavibacteriaceae bacterium]